MSINTRPTRCPHCQDDQLHMVARIEHDSSNELDEILYVCFAHGHEFTWNETDTDESLAAAVAADTMRPTTVTTKRPYDGHTIVVGPVTVGEPIDRSTSDKET